MEATVRLAAVEDAAVLAQLLHDFNAEYETHTPGVDAIAGRLRALLAQDSTFALLGGDPPCAVALVTLRPNVWYDGPVALLDELYVAPAQRGRGVGGAVIQRLESVCRERGVALIEVNVDEGDVDGLRFYERHGLSAIQPETGERAYYVSRELDQPAEGPTAGCHRANVRTARRCARRRSRRSSWRRALPAGRASS